MGRPFRYYCFSLAEKLHLTIDELLNKLDSNEISEWMAYDLSKTEKFQDKIEAERQAKESAEMTGKQKASLFKSFFKGK